MLKNIMDNINTAKELADKLNNLELKSVIVDLKEQILELREENVSLKTKLQEKEDNKIEVDSEYDIYWITKKDGTKEGPYCHLCYDSEKKLIRLEHCETSYLLDKQNYYCRHCKQSFYEKDK